MSGISLLVDTNILINFLNGDSSLEDLFEADRIFVSFITEIEFLSFNHPSEEVIKELFKELVVIDLNKQIKEIAIDLRKKYKLKLPDALIAATSIFFDTPLLTYDTDFLKIKELTLFYRGT